MRKAALVRAWKRSLREVCERGRFRVVHFSLQRDHAHLLVEAASARDLACGMKSIGTRLARAVQRTFHLRDSGDCAQTACASEGARGIAPSVNAFLLTV